MLAVRTGPDLGLDKLGSCVGPPQPGGLHNQGGSTTRGPTQPGASTYVLSPFTFWYSRVGWASTAPLLKAAQGPPQPGVDMSCHLLCFGIQE